jgi:hypothetical protein
MFLERGRRGRSLFLGVPVDVPELTCSLALWQRSGGFHTLRGRASSSPDA